MSKDAPIQILVKELAPDPLVFRWVEPLEKLKDKLGISTHNLTFEPLSRLVTSMHLMLCVRSVKLP
jgi:hypothetical protein